MLAEWHILRTASDGDGPGLRAFVRLNGDLDFTVLRLLAEHLGLLADRKVEQLTLDLRGVTFMDCAAAGVIFAAARSALPRGTKPVIRAPSRAVYQLLQVTGLDQECELDWHADSRRLLSTSAVCSRDSVSAPPVRR
jgi:anti-anti-sigma factor